jgi:hypothetical protein
MLIWLIFHNYLPTNLPRLQRRVVSNSSCCWSNYAVEDMLHCLRDCLLARTIWDTLDFTIVVGFWSSDVVHWINKFASTDRPYLFLAGLRWLWRNRYIRVKSCVYIYIYIYWKYVFLNFIDTLRQKSFKIEFFNKFIEVVVHEFKTLLYKFKKIVDYKFRTLIYPKNILF